MKSAHFSRPALSSSNNRRALAPMDRDGAENSCRTGSLADAAGAAPVTIDSLQITRVMAHAVATGAVGDATPSAVFYDLTVLETQFRALRSAFPKSGLHCFAVKACPVVSIIRCAANAGLGAECASIGEVAISVAAGVEPWKIVFDSPAKTDQHLRECLKLGIHLNADNIDEVVRISRLAGKDSTGCFASTAVVGLRINPQTGSSSYPEMLTSARNSKFGVPLNEMRQEILDAFKKYSFLSCVHVHVGSQGCGLDVLVEGASVAVKLAGEINSYRGGQVTSIDIGGGITVDYQSDETGPIFGEYVEQLRRCVPQLFDYRIITEFGRKLIAKAGWIAAKVQHVKCAGGHLIATTHAGADVFVRTVYSPEKWPLRLEFLTADGCHVKEGCEAPVDVAGPICFTGDLIAVGRMMPKPSSNDWLIVRDAGAYTLSLYSRHTSQLVPPVYGYEELYPTKLRVLKKAETLDALVEFWSA